MDWLLVIQLGMRLAEHLDRSEVVDLASMLGANWVEDLDDLKVVPMVG